MIIVGAALGLIAVLARRSLWRAVTRVGVVLLLATLVASAAMLVAGPRWPWVALSGVLLVTAGDTWKTLRWTRAVHAVAIARLLWFGWQWVMEARARAWTRATRPLPPSSS